MLTWYCDNELGGGWELGCPVVYRPHSEAVGVPRLSVQRPRQAHNALCRVDGEMALGRIHEVVFYPPVDAWGNNTSY